MNRQYISHFPPLHAHEEIKAIIVLAKTTSAEIAERMGASQSQVSSIIKNVCPIIIELTQRLGLNPFQMPGDSTKKTVKKGTLSLSPEEIKAQPILNRLPKP